jgi:hypothetical protein
MVLVYDPTIGDHYPRHDELAGPNPHSLIRRLGYATQTTA